MSRAIPGPVRWALFSTALCLGRAPAQQSQAELPQQTRDEATLTLDRITVHRDSGTLSFPAVINLDHGVLEVVIATPNGRLHEALLKADVSPLKLQAMLYSLNLRNGPRLRSAAGRRGDLVDIDLEYRTEQGQTVREPVEAWIRDTRSGKNLERTGWVFTGSTVRQGVFLADAEGNICINYSVGSTVLDSPDPQSTDDTIHTIDATKTKPGVGTKVRVILTPRSEQP